MKDSEQNVVELLKRGQQGDQQSLQKLCVELKEIVRWYFLKKFQDPDIVDDLLQETYLRFLKNISNIKEPMRLKNFILKVAFHVTQDYFRQKYRRNEDRFTEETTSESEIKNPTSRAMNYNIASDYVLSKLDLEKAMDKLPKKTQKIIQMKADGYKYEEIAVIHKISVSGVKMQIKRGIEKLKISLFSVTFWVFKTIILLVSINLY